MARDACSPQAPLWLALLRASSSLSRRLEAPLRARGLTLPQFALLERIACCGPLRQCTIGEQLCCTDGNVTGLVDALENRALVRRTRDPRDRRAWAVHLTEKGTRATAEASREQARVLRSEMMGLTRGERTALRGICEKLQSPHTHIGGTSC